MANNNSSRRLIKWIFLLVVAAAVGGGAYWYYRKNSNAAPQYQTVQVTRGDLTQAVTATGQLGPVLSVDVGSQISGIVRALYVDFNSVVKSNQVVAEIDPSTYQLDVLKAEAQLANSKANLALAEVQARRADALYSNNLISASDHDIAIAQMQQGRAQVQSDEANLKSAQVQLSYCTIYAPVDGVVISRDVDVGQTVAASFNTPQIFLIANDLAKMQIDALVSEADIGGVAVGQDVSFTVDAFPYRTFHGKVNQVRYGAITNQNVISYDCVVGVSNPDLKLLPSMTANVSIIIAQREGVLKIPNAAFRFHPLGVTAASDTNIASKAVGQNDQSNAGGAGRGGGRSSMGGIGGGAAGAGGGSGGVGGSRPRGDRPQTRTVYVLPAKVDPADPSSAKPKPIQIRIGISDGISTEVVDGLDEGSQVVVGVISTGDSSSRPGAPAANPFGGGGGRGGRF
jgi:HlyD family secretion protein